MRRALPILVLCASCGSGGSSGGGGALPSSQNTNGGGTSGGGGAPLTSAGAPSTSGASARTTSSAPADPSCSGADPSELSVIKAWLNGTSGAGAFDSWVYPTIAKNFPAGAAFDTLACSIAMSCVEFAPMESGWLRKCAAVLTSAILAESSFDPGAVNPSPPEDPTVGLLQVRFSSDVASYNAYGPMPKIATIGCSWPQELLSVPAADPRWKTAGETTYLAFMKSVPCNIGLGAWAYFQNATGNGGSSVVWTYPYCQGQGRAGNMVAGLLSHLEGGAYSPRPADGKNPYPWGIECCACGSPSDSACASKCTGCQGRFAAFMGIGTTAARPSPDPFAEVLAPEPTKYCR